MLCDITKNKSMKKKTQADNNNRDEFWIYGYHAVIAALKNPNRPKLRLVLSSTIPEDVEVLFKPELISKSEIAQLLPQGALHQGIALLTRQLPVNTLDSLLVNIEKQSIVVAIDSMDDPHNLGAILRSSAAFGADAVMITERNSPELNGTVAKAASGALDIIPVIKVTNISRSLEKLKNANYWCLGLDNNANTELSNFDAGNRVVLILGSEGKGIRRLTKETCDHMVRIPISQQISSLNVSVSAAIALHKISERL